MKPLTAFSAICFLLSVVSITGLAQADELQPVYTGTQISDFFWSSDSQQLILLPTPEQVGPLEANRLLYDATQNTSIGVTGLPLQTRLSASIVDNLRGENKRPLAPMTFASPDDRYLVTAIHTSSDEETRRWETVFVDLTSNRVINTSIPALGITRGPHFFNVIWSADGETFVLATSALMVSEPSFFHRVTGYSEPEETLEVQNLTRFEFESNSYGTLNVYDISGTGDTVLLRVTYATEAQTGTQGFSPLFIWDREGKHQILVDEFDTRIKPIVAATFAPDNENQ